MPAPIIPLVASDTVWLSRGPFPTGTSIALDQGWFDTVFAPLGYKVKTLQDAQQPALRSQSFYHDIKMLIREVGNVHPLWMRASNLKRSSRDQTVVVGLTWLDEAQVLIGRQGDKPGLRGKRLGLSHAPGEIDVWRAMALRAYDTALKQEGLTFADVTLVDIAAPPIQWQNPGRARGAGSEVTESALLGGEVDVIFARGGNAFLFQQKHDLDILLDINRLNDPLLRVNNGNPRLVVVHRHFIDDHPQLVKAFLQVLNAAALWARGHEDAVARVIAAETATTIDSVRLGYTPGGAVNFDISLDSDRVAALQNQANFLFAHKLIDAPVDVADWIDPAPLQAARIDPFTPSLFEGVA